MIVKQEHVIVRSLNGPYSLMVRNAMYDSKMVIQSYGDFKKVSVELMTEEDFNNKYPQRNKP